VIHVGNCLDILPTLAAESFDSIVTDPPYHLTTGKRGGTGPASLNPNSPGGRARIGTGFMGQAWDGGDVAFRVETWAKALRVAKPGAYLAAFGGTRTSHRLACAIEDAGWELRDTLMWVYGSGFPKSHNGEWGGTALKPAWEPIILARKPLIGTVAANFARYGTGGLNIDGCRIASSDKTPAPVGQFVGSSIGPNGLRGERDGASDALGRWPANLCRDGSDEVLAAFPHTKSGKPCGVKAGNNNNVFGQFAGGIPVTGFGDSGSAARFFYCAKASRADRNDGCDSFVAKPLNRSSGTQSPGTFQSEGTRRSSENNHPTVKPTDLMRWLVRLVTPAGGHALDLFAGSGSTGRAAMLEDLRFTGCELSPEYAAIARARIAACVATEDLV
jgi:site-specific DNA-methyltransferase (adenine-specific)